MREAGGFHSCFLFIPIHFLILQAISLRFYSLFWAHPRSLPHSDPLFHWNEDEGRPNFLTEF